MLGAVLEHGIAAGRKARGRGFTAPDGTFYKWNKKTPPTQADIDAIVKVHEEKVAPSKAALAKTGSAVTGMFGQPGLDEYGKGILATDPDAARANAQVRGGKSNPKKELAAAIAADPRPEGVKTHEFTSGIAQEIGKFIEPVTRPVGNALAAINPFYWPARAVGLAGPETGGNLLSGLTTGVLSTPSEIAGNAGLLMSGRATIPEAAGAIGELALDLGVLDPLTAAKYAIKGGKAVVKPLTKAGKLEKGLATVADDATKFADQEVGATFRPKQVEAPVEAPSPKPGTKAAKKSVATPKTATVEPETPPKKATGLANQVQGREAIEGIINEVEPTKGKGAEHWQKVGKQAVEEGSDPTALAKRIGRGEEELTGEKVGILLEGKRQLQAKLNKAAPGEEFVKAQAELDEFVENVQQGKGRWSDVGRALQAGTVLDTGDFAQVIERVEKLGGKVDEKLRVDLEEMTGRVKTAEESLTKMEAELAAERAKRTTAAQARQAPRFSREDLDVELDELLKQFTEKTSKLSAGVDPEILPIMGKIAVNYMKRGVNSLDDVVRAVQGHFKDATYDDVIQAIDSLRIPGKTKSEIEKEIARLKAQAKSSVNAQEQIATLRKQLETGDYVIPTKLEKNINRRLANLKAERDLLKSEVMGRIQNTVPKTKGEKVMNVLNAPKSLKSSVDISAAGRQGWLLGLANPDKIFPAFWDQLKALVSPKLAQKAQNAILTRENAALYKRGGLHLSTLDGIPTHGEEAFAGKLFGKWKKLNPFKGSERAYNAYLNRIRADVFDRMVKWHGGDLTNEQLEIIGNYVNVATGRGGKSIPGLEKAAEALNTVMFSPRFTASRFEALALEPIFKSTGASLKQTAKARALVARQYAQMIGALGGTYWLAKAAGAEISTDRASSDFGKIKIGDTRIDPMAGLQQAIVLGHRLLTGEYTTTTGKKIDLDSDEFGAMSREDVAQRFARSKASPTLGTAWSLLTGKDYLGNEYDWKNAARDLTLPISMEELVEGAMQDGWDKDDFLGLLNFIGFNTNTYKEKEKKADPRG